MAGSKAVVLGALDAGATFYAGYPITPSSEIMHEWARTCVEKKDLKFIQMEDEIASIHAVIGASASGLKAFTATSGPGFSLMQEGLGLAFAMRLPLVIAHAQRQGPSTGMPTVAAQGDLLQTQYGTHGDYISIVLYPNSIEEAYQYTIEAFNAAEESLSPVILLLDGYVANIVEDFDKGKIKGDIKIKNRQLKPLTQSEEVRHLSGLTNVDGRTNTIDPNAYKKWIEERRSSVLKAKENYKFYEYNHKENSDTLLISFGITSRVVKDIFEEDDNYSYFRPITMFPVLDKEIKKISGKYKKIVVIEMNEGQYTSVLEGVLKRNINHIRVIGAGISKDQIEEELKKI